MAQKLFVDENSADMFVKHLSAPKYVSQAVEAFEKLNEAAAQNGVSVSLGTVQRSFSNDSYSCHCTPYCLHIFKCKNK